MSGWTHQQQVLVAILPKISNALSLFGDVWVITEVITHKGHQGENEVAAASRGSERSQNQPKLRHPYHRLLLAMCTYNMLTSVWGFQTTWAMPADSNRIWSIGTQATCSAQGFFILLNVAVPIYNACLALYYMLVIVFRFTEKTLVSRVEPIMHLTAGVWAFGVSTTMLAMGYFNDAVLWCWIASYPPGCLDSWTHGYPPENENPCTRGDLAWIFRWAFYVAPVWLCLLIASTLLHLYYLFQPKPVITSCFSILNFLSAVCTFSVYIYVHRQEKRTMKYRRPEAFQAQRQSPMRVVEEPTSQVQNQLMDIAHDEEEENDILMGEQRAKSTSTQHTEQSDSVKISSQVPAENRSSDDFNLDDIAVNRFGPNKLSSSFSLGVARISQWKERRAEEVKYNPRTKQVAQQSFWYLFSFYMVNVWSTTNRIYQILNNNETIFALTILHSFFVPLHGFLNFLVYQRPRYLIIRNKHPYIGRFGAMWTVLHFSFQKKQTPSIQKKRPLVRRAASSDNSSNKIESNPPCTGTIEFVDQSTSRKHEITANSIPRPDDDQEEEVTIEFISRNE